MWGASKILQERDRHWYAKAKLPIQLICVQLRLD